MSHGKVGESVRDIILIMTDALRLMNAKAEQGLTEAKRTNELMAESNRHLSKICQQNADIRAQVGHIAERQNNHERSQRESAGKIRLLEQRTAQHAETISEITRRLDAAGR